MTAGAQVSFDDEPLILVNPRDEVLGHLGKAACHLGEGILHRAFSVFLFAADGRVLLQQRSREKRLWPLFWSNTCCSHPRRGEELLAAATRRLGEEMSLASRLVFAYKFIYHARFGAAGAEHELCSVLIGRLLTPPEVNPREIAATLELAPAELDERLDRRPDDFTPWLHLEWRALRRDHWAKVDAL